MIYVYMYGVISMSYFNLIDFSESLRGNINGK